eukprot:PhF_6_TR21913/c1_g1_i3/m.31130
MRTRTRFAGTPHSFSPASSPLPLKPSMSATIEGNLITFSDMTAAEKKEVVLERVDFAGQSAARDGGVVQLDPSTVRSSRTGRGPLVAGWQETTNPILCAYKRCVVRLHIPFSHKLEQAIQNITVRDQAIHAYRNMFCWMDDWCALSSKTIAHFANEVR